MTGTRTAALRQPASVCRLVDHLAIAALSGAPLLLWAASAVLLAMLIHAHPVRLALNLLPFSVLYGAVWWGLRRVATKRWTVACLAVVAVGCVVPAFSDDRTVRYPVNARPESPALWSVTLQNPDQAIGYRLRSPADAGRSYTLAVRLERGYHGNARLEATVNSAALGALQPLPMDTGGLADDTLGVRMPGALLASRPVAEIVLHQTEPDPRLRVVVYNHSAGASLGGSASWFFDGEDWHRGVLQPLTGRIVSGAWVIELRKDGSQ